MLERIIGVFKLDVATFEAVEADESATVQAAIIVAIVGLFAAIGAFVAAQSANAFMDAFAGLSEVEIPFDTLPQISPIGAALQALVVAFVAWLVWSALTFFIGKTLFQADTNMGEMLRVIGFAQAPRLLAILNFIPCLGPVIGLVSWVWAVVASFIGIRQGLDLDNGKTLVVVILSFIGVLIVNWILGTIFALIFVF